MAKKKINFNILANSNERLKFLLEECNGGKNLNLLQPSQFHEFWQIIHQLLQDKIGDSETTDSAFVKDCLSLILIAMKNDVSSVAACSDFILVLKLVNDRALEFTDVDARSTLCKINEIWLADKDLPTISGMVVVSLRNLFCLALVEQPLAADLKRLGAFREHITTEILEEMSHGFRPLLMKLIQHPLVLASEAGQKFLAFLATLSVSMLEDIHSSIGVELITCKKKTALCYGKVYVYAWCEAESEVKPSIQRCMQKCMEDFLKHPRTGFSLSKHYGNLLNVIDAWNVEVRKKNNASFIYMIADCYRPILWKYLQSGYNSHRCNAVDLFYRAFPLQHPSDPSGEQELFDMQYNSMVSALQDDCHIVRVIAVRETCTIIPVYWTLFNANQVQELMTIITKLDANDISSFEVRRAVWRGLVHFISSPPAFHYLKQILPPLKDYVHEVNQSVRVAFLQLLIAIHEKRDPEFKFTTVVSITTLMNRLAFEKVSVGRYIVRLLLPVFYNPEMELKDWIKRFVQLIKTFPHSYRNFFMFSKKALSFDESHSIMCNLLSYMGGYVRERLSDTLDEDSQNDSSVCNVQQRRSSRRVSKPNETQARQTCAFDDPDVVLGLFDIITILWVLCDIQLNKPAHAEKRITLLDTYIKFIHAFINYYKESTLFNSIITLSGNVPVGLLTANNVTLPGYCMKKLKSMEINDEDKEERGLNQAMLSALIKWGRGSVVLEQVYLWIEAAFGSLNASVINRIKRVKISETIKPNSDVAVYLLDTLLKTQYMKCAILEKNYDQLLELWKMMEGIKDIVLRRLRSRVPFSDPLLSDQFISNCYRRYLLLVPLLHPRKNLKAKPANLDDSDDSDKEEDEQEQMSMQDDKFNAPTELNNMIAWAQSNLLCLLQDEDESQLDLLATFINNILYLADNMIMVRMLEPSDFSLIAEFMISLLTSSHCLYFIRSASRMATAMNFVAKLLEDEHDELRIWSICVPSLFSHALNALVSRPHSIETIEAFKEDLAVVKTNFGKIFATYENNFQTFPRTKDNLMPMRLLMQKSLQALRVVLGREVPRSDLSVPVYSSLSQLPPVAVLILNPLYKQKFWTPMFLLVLKENLSRSVKNLLIDILILNLFSKMGCTTFNSSIENVWRAAKVSLEYMRRGRSTNAPKSLGLTLTHAEERGDENKEDGAEEQGLPAPNHERVSGEMTQPSTIPVVRDSEEMDLPSTIPVVRDSEEMDLPSTIPVVRGSEEMDLPSTNPVERNSDEMALPSINPESERLTGSTVPTFAVTNMATMATDSQPLSSQGGCSTALEPITPQARDARNVPESELIDDFIGCGSELLNQVKEFLQSPQNDLAKDPLLSDEEQQ